jgi:hypothetical protein
MQFTRQRVELEHTEADHLRSPVAGIHCRKGPTLARPAAQDKPDPAANPFSTATYVITQTTGAKSMAAAISSGM